MFYKHRYKLPRPPAGRDNGESDLKARLQFEMIQHEHLKYVAQGTRRALADALVTRFFARVWDKNAPDLSLFRNAAVVLVPPFHAARHLDELNLDCNDEEALPRNEKALVPTSDTDVDDMRDSTWE